MDRPRYFAANEALAFGLELAALAALAWWGWEFGTGLVLSLLFAIATPLVAAVFWGVFAAPKARIPVSLPLRLTVKAIVFLAATLALATTAGWPLAVLFALIVIANTWAATVWHRQGHTLL